MPVRVFTDKLQKMAKELGSAEGLEPVDLNGAYVAVDKYAPDNLSKTQKNINWRLATEPAIDFEEGVKR